jgi:hypothetical protein
MSDQRLGEERVPVGKILKSAIFLKSIGAVDSAVVQRTT